ncbi:MAG: hypothetical protein IJK81_07510 [Selenomonadaceae bacterium]|nr:hypothetical protein [Selenomonadaceae bacterium]
MKISKTAYDDAFRTLLNDCSELIIPVVNEVFGEHYTGKEKIIFGVNEHFLNQDMDNVKKIITDSSFVIIGSDGVQKRYHIECQSTADDSMLVRIFEYDAQIALDSGSVVDDSVLTVTFPNSAVIFLRHTGKTPNEMRIRMITPGGSTEYLVPVVKVQKYSLEEIFSKRLLFFIPFYIFSHEKHFPEYESNELKLQKLCEEYSYIQTKLDDLQKTGEVSEFTKSAVCVMTNHVLALIAQKYHRVQEGVENVMRGKILDYEAKTIRNKGREEGIAETMAKVKAETEERAKDMLRDKMTLPLVEKYTHLPMPRIEELARGLGLL